MYTILWQKRESVWALVADYTLKYEIKVFIDISNFAKSKAKPRETFLFVWNTSKQGDSKFSFLKYLTIISVPVHFTQKMG